MFLPRAESSKWGPMWNFVVEQWRLSWFHDTLSCLSKPRRQAWLWGNLILFERKAHWGEETGGYVSHAEPQGTLWTFMLRAWPIQGWKMRFCVVALVFLVFAVPGFQGKEFLSTNSAAVTGPNILQQIFAIADRRHNPSAAHKWLSDCERNRSNCFF